MNEKKNVAQKVLYIHKQRKQIICVLGFLMNGLRQ